MSSTESEPVVAPPCVDLDHPNAARVYDYYLGGNTNWAIDREFGKSVLAQFPSLRSVAMANRQFLNRTVRYLCHAGIRQFIDVGSGMPGFGNTHEIADESDPHSRVVYLDNDPVAVAHSQLLLDQHGEPERHAAVIADVRRPDEMWDLIGDTGVLDLDKPVAMLATAVLHFRQAGPDGADVGDEAIQRCRALLAPGSCLAISQLTDDGVPEDSYPRLAALKHLYDTRSSPLIWRSREQVRALLGDFELLDPAMTWTPLWHPEESDPAAQAVEFGAPNESMIWAGVGKKR